MKSVVQVENLKCEGCVNNIRSNLLKLSGVSAVAVDQQHSMVEVDYDEEELLEKIKQSLHMLGYPEIQRSKSLVHQAKSYVGRMLGRITPTDR